MNPTNPVGVLPFVSFRHFGVYEISCKCNTCSFTLRGKHESDEPIVHTSFGQMPIPIALMRAGFIT